MGKPAVRLLKPRLLFGIIAVGAIVFAAGRLGLAARLTDVIRWIAHLGPLAPAAFVGTYVIAAVLFVPGALLTISAGFLFGLLYGSIYSSVGATLGATSAFIIGRYVARDWVARKLDGNPKFKAIDQAVAREGWKIVGLARLSPVFPFNLLNYAFGLTNIPLKDYFLASWAGMLPGTVLYVYIGALAGDLTEAQSSAASLSPARWPLEIAGFLATVAVVIYVTQLARKALQKKGPG